MSIPSFRVSRAVGLLFLVLVAVFGLLGAGEAIGSEPVIRAGAACGIAGAVIGWYISCALVTNKTVGRTVIPLGASARRG